jgi:hypothetical protein
MLRSHAQSLIEGNKLAKIVFQYGFKVVELAKNAYRRPKLMSATPGAKFLTLSFENDSFLKHVIPLWSFWRNCQNHKAIRFDVRTRMWSVYA